MSVNAGELRDRIAICRPGALDPDGYGEPRPEVVHICRARYTETSGRELLKANADFGEIAARFLIRRTRKEIDRKMFVLFVDGAGNFCQDPAKGRFEIQYINRVMDGAYQELWCKWFSQSGGPEHG